VRTLVVTVVGDQQTRGTAVVVQSLGAKRLRSGSAILKLLGNLRHGFLLAGVDKLHQLARLASRCSAHVQAGHTGTEIHEKGRNHADNFLTTDVSNLSLGHEELLERGEGSKSANDLLGGGHPPSKLVGVPRNWARRVNKFVLIFDRGDLGNVKVPETLLDSKRVAVNVTMIRIYSKLAVTV
jgi:hypothetical protein